MVGFEYTEPSGDDIAHPTEERVIASMRRDYDEYWGPYSLMGWLKCGNPPSRQLILIRHPSRGWYLEYGSDGPPVRRVVAIDIAGRARTWVEHWHEGRTSYFPAACFLPQSVAERAVSDFLAARDPSASGAWEPFRWRSHKRAEPPPDGLLQWLLRRRPVVERAEPPA